MLKIYVRGGGDLASGAILRMHRAGWRVLVAELPQPLAVRRMVSFSQAVFDREFRVEEAQARRVERLEDAEVEFSAGHVPVAVDPDGDWIAAFEPDVLVDARMRKQPPEIGLHSVPFIVGLGPGFTAGVDCHAVVETIRGPRLGRVYWQGTAEPDTGLPEPVNLRVGERVLRASSEGIFQSLAAIGDMVREGQALAVVGGQKITAPFDGLVRGLLQDGLPVRPGQKVGDVDPRGDPALCRLVSDKALAVGGGVLEAILSWRARNGAA